MHIIWLSFIVIFFSSHLQLFATDTSIYPIIPKPTKIIASSGTFYINSSTKILFNSPEAKELANYISDFLLDSLNCRLKQLGRLTNLPLIGNIVISIDQASTLPAEGYQLLITPENILINAQTATGAFRAFTTLQQLIPAEIYKHMPLASGAIAIPCMEIQDAPRFAYRGLHLDVSRHFFTTDFIKKYIDAMAFYKLNTFHWHLTDDQGWRIEIKKYNKLQEIAAFRDQTIIGHKNIFPESFDGKIYGGYYTQEEIKEIIAYAKQRHIEIIPEIELPGHSSAVLAAYPELGCNSNIPYKTESRWGIHPNNFCAGKENVFKFLEDVLSEIIELFPSKYIHIGGDEVLKNHWKNCPDCQKRMLKEDLKNENELQSYFIKRIEKFVNAKDRLIIGWDEILDGGLSPNAIVMSWRGTSGGIKAAQLNHQVIMTPEEFLYFDHYQSKSRSEPLAIGGYIPLDKVYHYEPIPVELDAQQSSYILGVQANVWTEYMLTHTQVEHMVFPRAAALAEIAWSTEKKDYKDFSLRLNSNLKYLRAMSINYAE